MHDRELLQWAAKAAKDFCPEELVADWNPLVDDAQAFRLMTRLRIYLTFPDFEACGDEVYAKCPEASGVVAEEPLTPDGYRRSVVRLAAEIGKRRT
ncbi:hypothetical protein [Pseudomonas soli]|uniref:hypothetical protein n=1 Tax=Pseudomonas soli TaxID=1306993 RepID=UPI003DA98F6A